MRRKLAAAGAREPLVVNEWGIGYRLRLPGWGRGPASALEAEPALAAAALVATR